MKVFYGANTAPAGLGPSAIALGNFDGLHLGHQALITRLLDLSRKEDLLSLIYTFDPHPAEILHPEKKHQNLYTRQDLIDQVRELGVDGLILEPFNKEFAAQSAEDFLKNFILPLQPRHLVVGHDFAFGHNRSGSKAQLIGFAKEQGFSVDVTAPVTVDGQPVSSTWIRQAVSTGDLQTAKRLLGRPYSISGVVRSGSGRGKTLQVPTANIHPEGILLPLTGVYATEVQWEGKRLPAVTNVGVAPTFGGEKAIRLETHILDQNLSLVGRRLQVEFLSYLRAERKFSGAAELVAQIHRDIESARQIWKGCKPCSGRS